MKIRCFVLMMVLCLPFLVFSQTVTVAPVGADFQKVADAVDSFNLGGSNYGNPADNIINITSGTTYIESKVINILDDGNWTIQCTDSTPATLVVPAQDPISGTNYIGLIHTGTKDTLDGIDGSITLENLIIMPVDVAGPGMTTANCRGIFFNDKDATTNLLAITLRDILVTANNGSNAPASDGTYLASGHFTAIANEGIKIFSGVDNLLMENVTSTHCGDGVQDHGDLHVKAGSVSRVIGQGCIFSYNYNNGYYLSGGDLSAISGTADEPVLFVNNLGYGFQLYSSGNDIGNVSYARFIGNGFATDDDTATTAASGIHIVGSIPVGPFDHCFFDDNGSGTAVYGNISAQNSQIGTFTFTNCTIFNARFNQPGLSVSDAAGNNTFSFTDCIFAGAGDYLRCTDNEASIILSYCAIVKNGPDTINTALGTGGLYPNDSRFTLNNVINDDPVFISYDPNGIHYLDVTNSAYLTANSTGGPLTGAANFYVPVAVSFSSWNLYE